MLRESIMNILFNNIGKTTNYLQHIELLYSDYNLFRKKHFSNLCLAVLKPIYPDSKLLLTHSATGALEMIALLMGIEKGDEVIIPSFTFVSSANAFVSRGATPVFADIEPETLNIDLDLVENLITPKTKAIVAVHYAGHACDLNRLKAICAKQQLFLVEDAAMAFGNTFEGQPLGTIGDFGVIRGDGQGEHLPMVLHVELQDGFSSLLRRLPSRLWPARRARSARGWPRRPRRYRGTPRARQ